MSRQREENKFKNAVSFLSRPNGLTGPAIVLMAAFVAVGPFFWRGASCGGDFGFHLVSWIDAQHSITTGLLYPHWANSPNFGAGEPRFVFYPPLSWMGGAVLGIFLPWQSVRLVLSILLLAAIGMANRALAREMMSDGPATLAGCAAIFLGYALFSVYMRCDYAELMGGFWIPLLLLFALRRRKPAGNFWEQTFDGSAVPLALIVAGIWLSNGPVGIMASYLLAAVALISTLIERSLAPMARAAVSTGAGMALASLYLIPAVWEKKWASIEYAVTQVKYVVENNWLFTRNADPFLAPHDMMLHQISILAVTMLVIVFGAGAVAWIRGVEPVERRWSIPLALIPLAVLFLLLPVSQPVWNAVPELRLLQFPWRWLTILEAPMAIWFALAVCFDRRTLRRWQMAACAAIFVGISLAAQHWWYVECGSSMDSLQQSVREGMGVFGKPEYGTPGTQFPFIDPLVDSNGNPLVDPRADLIVQSLPSACLLDKLPDASVQGDAGSVPVWRGNLANCNGSGWHELVLTSGASGLEIARSMPEQRWITGVAEHAGYLILPLRYYPAWGVKVNGTPVTATAEQWRGLMAVPVPQGNVHISVDWTTTGDVVAGRWVSGIALLLVTGLYLFERKLSRAQFEMGMASSLRSTQESKHSISTVRTDRRNRPSGKTPKPARHT
jgi:hypothetical protein